MEIGESIAIIKQQLQSVEECDNIDIWVLKYSRNPCNFPGSNKCKGIRIHPVKYKRIGQGKIKPSDKVFFSRSPSPFPLFFYAPSKLFLCPIKRKESSEARMKTEGIPTALGRTGGVHTRKKKKKKREKKRHTS